MSEKSDDIKQLFSHLGLNPSDYQEIRSAPSSGATMTEAPRRWSLLQAISSPNPVPSRVSPSITPAAAPVPPPQPAPAQWAEILPGLNTTVPRVEAPAAVPPSPPPVSEGLSSLFQSVREAPLPVEPAEPPPMTGEQAADRLYRELRSSAQTLAARNPPPPPVTPPWAGYDPDLETRHAPLPPTPMPVRLAEPPAPPTPPSVPASVPSAAATTPVRMVVAPAAPDPVPPAMSAPPRPAPAPAPVLARSPVATEVRPATPPPPPRAASAAPVASTGLQAAFRRLSEPEPPRVAASGRLRLNYQLPHTSAAGASKDERLGDVLKRISGHNGSIR